MVKKRYTEKPAALTLKIEAEFLRQIDAEVLAASVREGHIIARSDVVKDLLREALSARAKKRK
jgi:hypothetical protein